MDEPAIRDGISVPHLLRPASHEPPSPSNSSSRNFGHQEENSRVRILPAQWNSFAYCHTRYLGCKRHYGWCWVSTATYISLSPAALILSRVNSSQRFFSCQLWVSNVPTQ